MPAENTTGHTQNSPIVADPEPQAHTTDDTPESQINKILAYLEAGHSLTPLQALSRFNNLSLSQTIGRLKRRGYRIRSEMIRTKSGKRIARYHYVQSEGQQ
jgi:hypothetical protein